MFAAFAAGSRSGRPKRARSENNDGIECRPQLSIRIGPVEETPTTSGFLHRSAARSLDRPRATVTRERRYFVLSKLLFVGRVPNFYLSRHLQPCGGEEGEEEKEKEEEEKGGAEEIQLHTS